MGGTCSKCGLLRIHSHKHVLHTSIRKHMDTSVSIYIYIYIFIYSYTHTYTYMHTCIHIHRHIHIHTIYLYAHIHGHAYNASAGNGTLWWVTVFRKGSNFSRLMPCLRFHHETLNELMLLGFLRIILKPNQGN